MKTILQRAVAIVRDLYTYRYFNDPEKAPRYRGVYATFEEAERAIPKGRPEGFNLDEVPEFFIGKQFLFNPQDYPVLVWLSQAFEPGCRVFDLGGGFGQCYYKYREYIRYPEGLEWTVCDVESFASRGPEFARQQNADALHFTTERAAADGSTIYLTNGALQYIEPDLPEILGQLSSKPRHVLVNRVPLYDGEPYFSVQSSLHSFVVHKVGNTTRLIRGMEALGYSAIDQWTLPRSMHVYFHPECDVPSFRGFYFRKS
ncbi:MAG: methyltransferase, TIGR04325 family [Silvibacterium sp.]|nr:methyltransferase, TIGR04325 family [Silvibacterium sp.]